MANVCAAAATGTAEREAAAAILFVPGVDDFVERTFQGYVGRAAR